MNVGPATSESVRLVGAASSRKISAKSVSLAISPEQAADYLPWLGSQRELRALVHELEALGLAVITGDPPTRKRTKPDPAT